MYFPRKWDTFFFLNGRSAGPPPEARHLVRSSRSAPGLFRMLVSTLKSPRRDSHGNGSRVLPMSANRSGSA